MSYTFHQSQGLYVRSLRRKGRCHAQVRKRDLRGAVTHVALICDRSDVQPKLPQVVICNSHRFTKSLLASVASVQPSSVHLFRRKSSWNNTSCMCEILELLAKALKDFPAFQPILLLDTCSCHVSDVVSAKAAALGIWLVPVPPGLTHLLQPLDVYTFSGYKQFLRSAYRKACLRDGHVSPPSWLKLLFQACTQYLNSRQWSAAFSQVGLGPPCAAASQELQAIFPDGLPRQRDACLTSAELAKLLPKGKAFRAIHWVRAPAGRKRILTVH